MRINFDLSDIADFTKAVSSYQGLINYISQLDQDQHESLKTFYDKILAKSENGKYLDRTSYGYWTEINIHMVAQTWGNTSGGWQGIGGSAMTQAYTIVIENRWFDAIFVYYNGELAYIADSGEKLKPFRENSFRHLPGRNECAKKLDVIYVKRR